MIYTPVLAALLFRNIAAGISEARQDGLEKAANLVADEARDSLGTYQGSIQDIPAWRELADATKEDRGQRGFSENEPLLRSGALKDSIEVEVTDEKASVGSTEESAVFMEMGTVNIPQRSFLAGAAYRKEEEVLDLVADAIFEVIKF